MTIVDKISDAIEKFFSNSLVILGTNVACLATAFGFGWLDQTNIFISFLTLNMLLLSISSSRRDRKANAAVRDASILSNDLADNRLVKAEEKLEETEIDALRDKIIDEGPTDEQSASVDQPKRKKLTKPRK